MTMPLALLLLLLLASPRPAAARRTKASKQAFETPAAFTPAECGRIIAAASGRPQEQAVLHDGKGGSQRDVSSRDSTLAWLDVAPGSEMRWVLERMEAQLPRGESAWGVRSLGLGTQGIQVARYGPGHHYEWHTDSSAPVGGPTHGRIMSVTVQLSAPDEYTGGMVEMGTHGNVSTAIGTMALFPSFLPHKVHRVSSGVRYSIVAWFAGNWNAAYWRLAQSSYSAMLSSRPEICEAHEWLAETLASQDAMDAAKSSLVDCLDCNDGTRVLQQRVLDNSAGAARLPAALLAAERRFRAALADGDGGEQSDEAVSAVVARGNLEKVLRAMGRPHAAEHLDPVAPSPGPDAARQQLQQEAESEAESEAEAEAVETLRAAAVAAAAAGAGGSENTRDIEAAQDELLDGLLDDLDAEEDRQGQLLAAMSAAAATETEMVAAVQDDLLDDLLDEL